MWPKKRKEKHKREQIKPIFGPGGAPKYSQTLSGGMGKGRNWSSLHGVLNSLGPSGSPKP